MKTNLTLSQRRSYAKSSSFMMALLFTILCGGVALTLGYFINFFAKGHFVHSTQAVLDSEIKYLNALDSIPIQNNPNGRLYVTLNPDGSLPSDFPEPSQILTEGLLVFHFDDVHKHFAGRIHTMADGQKILVGTDITNMIHDFQFMQWIGVASIAFIMMVVFVAFIISIFVVNGTNKIAGTAYEIIRTGDLSRRVDMSMRWDDLGNMANILNLLLDRIQDLMQGVRQVSDNIAHDLRTPLTRMRSHIEDIQNHDPDNKEHQKLLDEADQILNTFNALLRISRIETEQKRSKFKDLQLHNVLQDVIDFYEPLAEAKQIQMLSNLDDISFFGDRDLLFQAFANIIDNAVKFTPAHDVIAISLSQNTDRIQIIIDNNGEPIPEDDLPKIFDRFYRGDKSRNSTGTGLGLSLVAAVITLHGGRISAHNTDDGIRIITIL